MICEIFTKYSIYKHLVIKEISLYYVSMDFLKLYVLNTNDLNMDDLIKSSFLNDDDISSFQKFKVEQVKKEKIASLYLKRKYIGDFYIGENGKPLSHQIDFNISHSFGVVVLVISNHPVGVDIEKIREYDSELKRFISNDEEFDYIKNDKDFFSLWTSKEALVKADGLGLKTRANDIPGLPIEGKKVFRNEIYTSKQLIINDYIINISRESEEVFDVKIIDEIVN